ncbi:gliding motility lipoprotein GldH [Weeksellaceae bacterium TAE3-ERU29]|nr:gliding motility lipoprotein GldH [Weeksellaceae bacterium TAE3-ERU29]
MKINFLYLIVGFLSVIVGCESSNNYYQKEVLLSNQWQADSAVTFDVPVKSPKENYDIFMILRNNNEYPYSNIYFFTEFISPTGNKIIDTLEYQLAYSNGKWIGSGMSDIKQNTLVYKENINLPDTGTYKLRIKQAMRENPLIGIEDIGLIIEKEK